MKLATWFVRATLAAAATTTAAHAAPPSAESVPGEAAVFARFSDLGLEETQARLASLTESRLTYSYVRELTAALARDEVTARELERMLLPLVAGLTEDDVDTTLAALMLAYFETHLRDGLATRELRPSDVFEDMIATDQLLTTAVYGPGGYPAQVRTRR